MGFDKIPKRIIGYDLISRFQKLPNYFKILLKQFNNVINQFAVFNSQKRFRRRIVIISFLESIISSINKIILFQVLIIPANPMLVTQHHQNNTQFQKNSKFNPIWKNRRVK